LGSSATPCLSNLIEDLKKISLFILVDGDIDVSTTGLNLSGGATDDILTGPRPSLPLSQLLYITLSF